MKLDERGECPIPLHTGPVRFTCSSGESRGLEVHLNDAQCAWQRAGGGVENKQARLPCFLLASTPGYQPN